jgi:hypothetical protein
LPSSEDIFRWSTFKSEIPSFILHFELAYKKKAFGFFFAFLAIFFEGFYCGATAFFSLISSSCV